MSKDDSVNHLRASISTNHSPSSLANLRLKLDELRNTEEDLLHRLADVRISIAEARSKIEGILRERSVDVTACLPDEILSEIFEQGRHLRPRDNFQADICNVSRRWRNIAICTPSLWSELSDYALCGEFDSHRNQLCTYLSRSRNCFLDIKLFYATELWPCIQPYAHRIYSLSLPVDQQLVNTFATVNAPNLRHLCILGNDWEVLKFHQRIFLDGAPLLKSLNGFFDVPGICFSSLVTLEIGKASGIPFPMLHQMILNLPSLSTLKLPSCILIRAWHKPHTTNRIHIPSLKHLHITFEFGRPDIRDVISFSAPELEDLTMPGSMPTNLTISPSLRELFLSSYPNVRRITIRDDDRPAPLATLFPNIFSLTVVYQKNQKGVSRLLGDMYSPEGPIWPHLKELTIRPVDALAMYPLYYMLSSRRAVGFPIARLHLICKIGSNIEWTYYLRRLSDVDVAFTDSDGFEDE